MFDLGFIHKFVAQTLALILSVTPHNMSSIASDLKISRRTLNRWLASTEPDNIANLLTIALYMGYDVEVSVKKRPGTVLPSTVQNIELPDGITEKLKPEFIQSPITGIIPQLNPEKVK